MKRLPEPDWHDLRAQHESRVLPWVSPRLERSYRHETHPVEDFLFDYYPYRPGQLLRWHPGLGYALQGESAEAYLTHKGYAVLEEGIAPEPLSLKPPRLDSIRWMRGLLRQTADRPAQFGCFGLHEWAMVYRTHELRHGAWPLRLAPEAIDRVVEQLGPRCTHYDALRFFTPPARPLNKWEPTRQTTADFEQPACLHANMDLYKWAFKLSPFASSKLVADCFDLARAIRIVDMRASPYDFSALDLAPIPIETPEGRAEYEEAQRDFSERAAPLRDRLAALCEQILAAHVVSRCPSA